MRHLLLPSITADMVPEYLRIYPQLWSSRDLFRLVSELTPWRGYLVNQQYIEYASDIFGELGPDEEEVELWYSKADQRNSRWLAELDRVFKKDA